MSKFLSEETEKFFNPSKDELQKEKSRYGNLFMRARQAQIERLFRHMDLINKYSAEQQTNQNKYGHLLDKFSAKQQNIDPIHSRYGHLLDKYIK